LLSEGFLACAATVLGSVSNDRRLVYVSRDMLNFVLLDALTSRTQQGTSDACGVVLTTTFSCNSFFNVN
jgi:hypothetical protein